jgi:D-alanyl-D-alanine carboxypeptidase
MTALVALDAYQLQDTIEVPNFWIEGQKLNLKAGSTYTVSDLLYAMLLYSANDAAEVLARHYPGGRGAFIAQMNTKAQTLSLMNSHFMNPVGLDQAGHYSTARDMVRLSMIAMDNPVFSTIVSTKEKTITSVDGTQVHVLRNINQLLGTVDGVMGVKTGWTEEARENLVTYVTRGNKHVHIALLGSQDRFGETTELITWLFSSYSWKPVSLPLLSTR